MLRLTVLLTCLVLMFTSPVFAGSGSGDTHYVLMGVTLDERTDIPVGNQQVVLTDLVSDEETQTSTQRDGSFYFKLNSEKVYLLSVMDGQGGVQSSQTISPSGSDSYIIHSRLEVDANCIANAEW